MRKKYLAAAAISFCALFMYGCVASEGDVGFIYTRQKDLEANLRKAEKDIEWLKTEVSDEDVNLELKEQFHELQNKVLELEQVIGTVYSGVETVKTDLRKSAKDAERMKAEDSGPDETAAVKKRVAELESRVAELERAEALSAEAEKTAAATATAPPAESEPESEAAEEEPKSPEPEAAATDAAPKEPEAAEPEAAPAESPAEKPASAEPEDSPPEAPSEELKPAEPEAPAAEPAAQETKPPEPETSPEERAPAEAEPPEEKREPARTESAETEPAAEKPESHYDLGQRKLAEGKYRDARVLFRKYADANPVAEDAPEAVFLIADSYFMEKLYEEAILEYQNLIDIYPDSPRVTTSQLKQGIALLEIDKTNEAALFFESLIESHPKSPEAAEARKYLNRIKTPQAEE